MASGLFFTLALQGTSLGILVLIFQALFRKRIHPRFNFFMWLLVFAKFLIPTYFETRISFFNLLRLNNIITSPNSTLMTNTLAKPNTVQTTMAAPLLSAAQGIDWNHAVLYIWLGVALIWAAMIAHYYYTLKINIYKSRSEFCDNAVFIYESCFREAYISPATEVVFTSYVKSPLVFGFLNPIIVLPGELSMADEKELRAILLHEAVHIKNQHHKVKFICSFITALYWWNPLIWLFSNFLNREMEYMCDYEVLHGPISFSRKTYAESLLNVAKLQPMGAMSLYFGNQSLNDRVNVIMENRTFTRVVNSIAITIVIIAACIFFTAPKSYAMFDDVVTYNGHSYKVYDLSLSWDKAENYCEGLGGHLATITSPKEQTLVENLAALGEKHFYWLGGYSPQHNGEWQWVTGEYFGYSNWEVGQPDNYRGDEYYIRMIRDDYYFSYSNWNAEKGMWNDSNIGADDGPDTPLSRFGFICEWDSYSPVRSSSWLSSFISKIFT